MERGSHPQPTRGSGKRHELSQRGRSQTDFGEFLGLMCHDNNNLILLLKFYWAKNPSLPRLSCGYQVKFAAVPVELAPMCSAAQQQQLTIVAVTDQTLGILTV